MVERFNRTLLNILSISVQENETDCDLHLPAVMLAYRTSVHATTGETPFLLMFGREVSLPIDIMYGTPTNMHKHYATPWKQHTIKHKLTPS